MAFADIDIYIEVEKISIPWMSIICVLYVNSLYVGIISNSGHIGAIEGCQYQNNIGIQNANDCNVTSFHIIHDIYNAYNVVGICNASYRNTVSYHMIHDDMYNV